MFLVDHIKNCCLTPPGKTRMASTDVPTWFPAASNDRFPPNGQIILGSIITNTRQPENSLNNPTDLIPIPKELLTKSLSEINHTSEVERNRDYTAGAQLKLGEFVDSELSHGWSNKRTRGIVAERITSENFRPDGKYVAESIAKGEVAAYLKREVGYFKKKAPRIFMITGVKIAHEAVLSRAGEHATTSTAKVNADVGGFKVAVGPFGSRTAEDKHSHSFQPEGDFVYAVRLKKFVFQKKKLVLENEYNTDGAEIHGDEKKEKEEEQYELELVSEEDVRDDTLGMESVVVLDKNNEVSKFAVEKQDEV